MPRVATIEGVRIEFYFNEHPPPHFHAIYAEHTAGISIVTVEIEKGFIPPAKFAIIRRWMRPRLETLRAAFEQSSNHVDPGNIE